MNQRSLCAVYLALFFGSGLLTQDSAAQLAINLTQAVDNGFDLDAFQQTIATETELDFVVRSDDQSLYSDDYDLISLNSAQADLACKSKELLDLSGMESFRTLMQKTNYLYENKNSCTLSFASFSLAIAYPLINMVTTRPESIADFFDVEHFPGMRALPDTPIGTLEWALLAYGIPFNEVYQLLSTKRGLKLAIAKLESIKRYIIWWSDIDELKQLMLDNKVTMAAGPHTAFYDLQFNHPMEILWDGQLLVEMKIGINAASTKVEESKQLLSVLMSDATQFKLAYEHAIGPTNRQTLTTLELLPQAGQILVFIPTYKNNMAKAIWIDYRWHNTLDYIINQQFKLWRNTKFE